MEDETVAEQTKAPTRKEIRRDLQRKADAHGERAKEFHRQYLELLVAKKESREIEQARLEEVLKNMPLDISAKQAREKILQMPLGGSDRQLEVNIERVRESEKFETAKQRELLGEIKRMDTKRFDKQADAHTKDVFRKFEDFLDAYKYCRNMFYNELAPIIQEGYELDPAFYRRAEKLGLNKSIMISIESHFRHGEKVYLIECLEKIMDLSDAYGPALLDKDFFAGTWPDDPSSTFYKESEFHN